MEIAITFKVLHIATMISAVTLALGPSLIGDRLVADGDVAATRSFLARMRVFEMVIPVLFVAGATFGLLAAITIGFDLTAPWLLVAYALFASTMGIQMSVGGRWRRRLASTAAALPDGLASSPVLAAVGHEPAGRLAYWWTAAATLLIVIDMVAKPFS